VVPAAHVPPGVHHLLSGRPAQVGLRTRLDLGAPPTDGESLRVVSFLPNDLRQNSSSGVDEPVADLEDRQAGFLGQKKLLGVAGVGVVSVVVEPPSQDKYGFLG